MATPSVTEQLNETRGQHEIEVPAPTAWPFILALGVTLLLAGLVTSTSVSVLGAVLAAILLLFPKGMIGVWDAAAARLRS